MVGTKPVVSLQQSDRSLLKLLLDDFDSDEREFPHDDASDAKADEEGNDRGSEEMEEDNRTHTHLRHTPSPLTRPLPIHSTDFVVWRRRVGVEKMKGRGKGGKRGREEREEERKMKRAKN